MNPELMQRRDPRYAQEGYDEEPLPMTYMPTSPGEVGTAAGMGVGLPWALSRAMKNPISMGRAAYLGFGPVGTPISGVSDIATMLMSPLADAKYQAGQRGYLDSVGNTIDNNLKEMGQAGAKAHEQYGLGRVPVQALHGVFNPVTSMMYAGKNIKDFLLNKEGQDMLQKTAFLEKALGILRGLGRRSAKGLKDVGWSAPSDFSSARAARTAAESKVFPERAAKLIRHKSVVEQLHKKYGRPPTVETALNDPDILKLLRSKAKTDKAFNESVNKVKSLREGIVGGGALGAGGSALLGGKLLLSTGEPKRASENRLPRLNSKEAQDRAAAYKVGFLQKLAELGVQPSKFMGQVKQAIPVLDQMLSGSIGAGRDVVSGGMGLAGEGVKAVGQAALLAPLFAGAATGTASALLASPSSTDIDSLRKSEILSLYRRLTKEVQARNARKAVAV